jgi:SAM-dependent methyltransferase
VEITAGAGVGWRLIYTSTTVRDFSLHSGERQVATEYAAIRADHRYRYEWVDACVPRCGVGIDVFCGNGYGTWLLAESRWVLGIDGSSEAIRLAQAHYRRSSTAFSHNEYPFDLPRRAFDFAVSLESIEHVDDAEAFFASLAGCLRPGGMLVFSTPCEDLLPLSSTGNHFHFRHYTLRQTLEMASTNGLDLLQWAGQDVYSFTPDGRQGPPLPESEMNLRIGEPGQFIVVTCRKSTRRPIDVGLTV